MSPRPRSLHFPVAVHTAACAGFALWRGGQEAAALLLLAALLVALSGWRQRP